MVFKKSSSSSSNSKSPVLADRHILDDPSQDVLHALGPVDLLKDEAVLQGQAPGDLAVLDVLGPDVLGHHQGRVRDLVVPQGPAVLGRLEVDVDVVP